MEKEIVRLTNAAELDAVLSEFNRVVALVYATWCPFCMRFLPAFKKQVVGKEGFVLMEDDREEVAEEYDVEIIPTVLCFENGRVVKRLDGVPGLGLTESQLSEFLSKL